MDKHKVNPILSNVTNILFSKIIYPTVEYQKENLKDDLYIFAPNHTNNLDGYLIWSLLNKNYRVTYYSYNNNYDKTKTKSISKEELIEYYHKLMLNTTFGGFVGAGLFSVPTYVINERKNKQKTKIK